MRTILYIFLAVAILSCTPPRKGAISTSKNLGQEEEVITTKKKIKKKKDNPNNEAKEDLASDKEKIVEKSLSSDKSLNSDKQANTETEKKDSSLLTKVKTNEPNSYTKEKTLIKSRTEDTSVVKLDDALPIDYLQSDKNEDFAILKDFASALKDFDESKFDLALLKFRYLKETIAKTDSLHFEAVFYESECLISNTEYDEALELLNYLSNTSSSMNKTDEKTMLRKGQIYCAMDNKKEATNTFANFKKKYPKSIYSKLANCESLSTVSK